MRRQRPPVWWTHVERCRQWAKPAEYLALCLALLPAQSVDALLGILNQLFLAVAGGKRIRRRLRRQGVMLRDCIRQLGCIITDGTNRGRNLLVQPVEFVTDLIDG